MNENELAALAKGLVPFVRQCVTQTLAPLTARIAELEARPIEKGETGERGPQGESGSQGPAGPPGPKGDNGEHAMVPAALAEQIKSAIHLLHESPPIATAAKSPSAPRVTRIERDETGNFVPIYDEPQS